MLALVSDADQGPQIGDIHATGRFGFRRGLFGRSVLQQEFAIYRMPRYDHDEMLPGWENFWIDVKHRHIGPRFIEQVRSGL